MEATKLDAMEHLEKYKVGSVPTVIYIPDFVSDSEQEQLLNSIYQAPASKWKSLKNRRLQNWGGIVHEKGLLAQELPPWLTKITNKISDESMLFPSAINHVLINEYLPDQGIMPHQDGPAYFPVVAILSLGSPVVMDFTPHPSLINKVGDSTDEGPVARNSSELSSRHAPFSVVLMPRSLLLFKDEAYSDCLHGIKDSDVHLYEEAVNAAEMIKLHELIKTSPSLESTIDTKTTGVGDVIHRTATRVSLTCRVVTKVRKNLFKF